MENKHKKDNLVLDIKNLNVWFRLEKKRRMHVIRGVDFRVKKGEVVGLVGESGSGKSVASKALLGLNSNADFAVDKFNIANLDAKNFTKEKQWRQIRGKKIGYIPQDPLTSLNPTRTIKKQLLDALENDPNFKTRQQKEAHIIDLLERFGIRNAAKVINNYPHTFSGGMKQRVVIAMVVALKPDLIIADEPTTALDPTVQANVLSLLQEIKDKFKISVIFISHNISVVAKFCDYLYVMYAGKIVEKGTRKEIFTNPCHPYTWALINSIPENKEKKLKTIPGTPPDLTSLPPGDPFASRNEYALEIDFEKEPELFPISKTHFAATWLLHPDAPKIEKKPELIKRLNSFKKVFK